MFKTVNWANRFRASGNSLAWKSTVNQRLLALEAETHTHDAPVAPLQTLEMANYEERVKP